MVVLDSESYWALISVIVISKCNDRVKYNSRLY